MESKSNLVPPSRLVQWKNVLLCLVNTIKPEHVMYSEIYNSIPFYYKSTITFLFSSVQRFDQMATAIYLFCMEQMSEAERKDRQVRTKPKTITGISKWNETMNRCSLLSDEMKTIVVDFLVLNLNCIFTLPYIN